ncbi:MAG: hypothetical protein LBF04_01665 [Prevotellaceae bacterium]|jgi:hypothetical protein|nr:hypothetical protein [Prevotellaceae bacterium]
MKKLLIFVLSTALCFSAAAQQKVEKNRKHGEKPDKEEIIEKKCKTVADKLMLDDAAAAKFTPVYKNYLKELSENVDFKKLSDDNITSDSDIDKNVRNSFERTRKTVDIREKYYGEFRKFLTAKQAKAIIKTGDAKRMKEKRFADSDSSHRHFIKKSLDFTHDKQRFDKKSPPLKTEQ